MAGFVYIIYSAKWDQFYVGSTEHVEIRLAQHNAGRNKSTRGGEPWDLKRTEEYGQIQEARRRELEIKRKKSRTYIEWLISSAG